MNKKHIILLVAAICSACSLNTVSNAETWKDVFSLAKENNNELKSVEKNLEAYEWSYKKSLTSFLPQLSTSVSYGESSTASSARTKSSSYGLSASQSLFRGFGNMNAARKAYAQMEYAKANLAQGTSDVFYDVRAAFTNLFVAEKDLQLQESILKRRKENAKLITLLYESGKEDRGNMMLTLADVESAKTAISQAKRALELAKIKLSQLTGKDIVRTENLSMEVTKPEDVDVRAVSESSPSYAMYKYTFDTAAIAADEALAGLLPSVSLSGNLSRSGSDWPPQSDSKSWSLSLSYPFFTGGANIVEKVIKEIEKEKARQSFEQNKKDLVYSIRSARNNFLNKAESLNVKNLYLKASEERAKIARTKYVNGLMTYDEWNRTEDSYIAAEKDLLLTQKESFIAEAAWHNSYGGWIK